MPKIKISRKSTVVDMTAMCDVSFLLLTFFILTAKFRPYQPVIIDIPSSRSETKVPDPLMTIGVDKDGKVYYSLSSNVLKLQSLQNLIDKYGDQYPYLKNLTDNQKNQFTSIDMMGFDARQLPDLLNRSSEEIQQAQANMPGIPIDSLNNQLKDWIMAGRYADPTMRIAIKGDKYSNIKTVQQIIKTLTQSPVDVHTFNLITSLEGAPGASTGNK